MTLNAKRLFTFALIAFVTGLVLEIAVAVIGAIVPGVSVFLAVTGARLLFAAAVILSLLGAIRMAPAE